MLHRSKKHLRKLRFLLDENIPKTVWSALTDFDVVWVGRDTPSVSDIEIYHYAVAKQRILVTLDRDFVQLRLFQKKKPTIILLRFAHQNPKVMADRLLWLIQHTIKWDDSLTVLSDDDVVSYP